MQIFYGPYFMCEEEVVCGGCFLRSGSGRQKADVVWVASACQPGPCSSCEIWEAGADCRDSQCGRRKGQRTQAVAGWSSQMDVWGGAARSWWMTAFNLANLNTLSWLHLRLTRCQRVKWTDDGEKNKKQKHALPCFSLMHKKHTFLVDENKVPAVFSRFMELLWLISRTQWKRCCSETHPLLAPHDFYLWISSVLHQFFDRTIFSPAALTSWQIFSLSYFLFFYFFSHVRIRYVW